jgi:hypothetical protein
VPSYVSRVQRLTLLAPDIVDAVLDGRQSAELQLDDLLERFPLDWGAQRTIARNMHERSVRRGNLGLAELYVIVGHGDGRAGFGARLEARFGAGSSPAATERLGATSISAG